MSISSKENDEFQSKQPILEPSKFLNLIRRQILQMSNSMKLGQRCKTTQVHAVNHPPDHHHHHLTINSILSNPNAEDVDSVADSKTFLPYGLPTTRLLEPSIDPHLKPVDFIDSLADLYRRIENSDGFEKSLLYIEQYSLLCALGDPKLLRRSLQSARQHAVDLHSKVVLSAWLRYERREDELVGISAFDCIGKVLECPKGTLVNGYDPNSVFDHCQCSCKYDSIVDMSIGYAFLSSKDDKNVIFCIENQEIICVRDKIAELSSPLKAMLYGNFVESQREKIDFSRIGISAKGMRAVEVFSRIKRLDFASANVVLEVLSFANQFCCEEMKLACEVYLIPLVLSVEVALIIIEYGLEERANLLVAACLQVLLRELPSSLNNLKVMNLFVTSEARERLAMVGHSSFLLYYFLSHVAMEEKMTSINMVMMLERLKECATEKWEKALALHLLGLLLLEREEYKKAQIYFEAAFENGHVYSVAGIARTKFKQGQRFAACELMNKILTDYKPNGWMYQERSLYNVGRKKISDLDSATNLDPTLLFPYKYRAVAMVAMEQIGEAVSEINKIIGFKVSPDCLELRAWFFIALEDYQSALRDIRALLTLEPNYMMFHGKIRGDRFVDVLSQHGEQWNPADCWLQLYERWSSIDDIGSLAVIHQMLANDPGKSLLRFRQSLLLLRLNCQKAAMRSLRLARNNSIHEHERLVYEGWMLYDTGYREEALSKAESAISLQRSFEAFFLKAYILADTTLDPESSSYVIQLLKDALKCPSDGLRKGQALNNLGSIYVDCGKLELAADCYVNALDIKHTRAHQGLARVYHLKYDKKAAYDEMTMLISKAENSASAYEKRSEYSDRDTATSDLSTATRLDPLRTYPYRYRAAVMMDEQRETEAVEELNKAIAFKPDLQMLHLRAAFHESMGDFVSALRDCEAALCLDPNHKDTLDLYSRTRDEAANQHR